MRSFKEVVWSLVAVSAVGLAMCACGASDPGPQDPAAEPTPNGEVRPDMTPLGCGGGYGCPCSANQPCVGPDIFCNGRPTGVCEPTTPCGNCSTGSSGGTPSGGKLSGGTHI